MFLNSGKFCSEKFFFFQQNRLKIEILMSQNESFNKKKLIKIWIAMDLVERLEQL